MSTLKLQNINPKLHIRLLKINTTVAIGGITMLLTSIMAIAKIELIPYICIPLILLSLLALLIEAKVSTDLVDSLPYELELTEQYNLGKVIKAYDSNAGTWLLFEGGTLRTCEVVEVPNTESSLVAEGHYKPGLKVKRSNNKHSYYCEEVLVTDSYILAKDSKNYTNYYANYYKISTNQQAYEYTTQILEYLKEHRLQLTEETLEQLTNMRDCIPDTSIETRKKQLEIEYKSMLKEEKPE